MVDIPSITDTEALMRLGAATMLGALVGLEREWNDHDAGLRTHAMVAFGSALFTLISAYALTPWIEFAVAHSGDSRIPTFVSDPGRIAAQIVSGIGFVGAGVIWRSSDGVRGLTTAATLWTVAALGMAVGFGELTLAAGGTLIVLTVLLLLRLVRSKIRRPDVEDLDNLATRLVVHLVDGTTPGELLQELYQDEQAKELISNALRIELGQETDGAPRLTIETAQSADVQTLLVLVAAREDVHDALITRPLLIE